MAPIEVNFENEEQVYNTLYPPELRYRCTNYKNIVFKFNVGDKVRLATVKRQFEKGYTPNWTEEIFIINQRIPRYPPVYKVQDQNGDIVQGTYYEPEIQKVEFDRQEEKFVIEKILARKRVNGLRMVLIKWRGYPDKFNSWEPEDEVVTV